MDAEDVVILFSVFVVLFTIVAGLSAYALEVLYTRRHKTWAMEGHHGLYWSKTFEIVPYHENCLACEVIRLERSEKKRG